MFEYFMVQIPPNISVKMGASQGAAAAYLADVVGQHAAHGWEFYSIETIGITESMGCGCLGFIFTIFGWKTQNHAEVYVIVFRRPRTAHQPAAPTPPPSQFQV